MLRFGHITNYDECGRVSVFLDEDGFQTEYIPMIVSNSGKDESGSTIDINSLVAVVLDDVNPMNGVCLGAVNVLPRRDINKKFHTFNDGTNLEYDRETHILTVDVKGSISASAENTTLTSPLNVENNIVSTMDISDKNGTMQAIRDFCNNHTHTNGNNGANTGKPTTQIADFR